LSEQRLLFATPQGQRSARCKGLSDQVIDEPLRAKPAVQKQYTILITAPVASVAVPTLIAQRWL
jgi:hypothetical protein